jgi:SpoVK/Ycf46/Vps4 family AAA+-type ATPase
MRAETVTKFEIFLDLIYQLEDDILNSFSEDFYEALKSREINIMDTLIEDIIHFVLYLTPKGEKIGRYSNNEKIFFNDILSIMKPYVSGKCTFLMQGKMITKSILAGYLDMYSYVYNSNPINYLNSDDIPLSFTIFEYYDRKFHKQILLKKKVLLTEIFCALLNAIGTDYVNCDDEPSDIKSEKCDLALDLFMEYIVDILQELKIDRSSFEVNADDNHQNNQMQEETKSLEDILVDLNKLIGLSRVKDEVNTIVNLIKINKLRVNKGFQQTSMSMHLVFSGNPGTGKTTVARILGEIYCSLGVLSKGHLIEVDRSGLVAGYVGQTAIKTSEIIQKALGGILFIDEAYSLTGNNIDSDYGKEAIDTLLKAMEDYREDFIVIVAGYPEPMEKFLKSNPGLESRFNTFIHFEDYSSIELFDIFINFCKNFNYTLKNETESFLNNYFDKLLTEKKENFANAREVRNLFERSIKKQANRLSLDNDISDDELLEIKIVDIN